MAIRHYPRGFIISESEIQAVDILNRGEWQENLWAGLHLYVREDLEVERAGDANNGVFWMGLATSVENEDSDENIAEMALKRILEGEDSFHEFLDFVVGRWAALVVIDGKPRIYHDVLGLQPVYFSRDHRVISSHLPPLIEEVSVRDGKGEELRELGQHKLWDETQDKRVGSLFANFFLDVREAKLVRYYPHGKIGSSNRSDAENVDEAITLAQRSAKFWASLDYDLYCALTAGLDTRFVAAAMLGSGTKLSFVTYGSREKPSSNDGKTLSSYKLDMEQAKSIASSMDVPHIEVAIEDNSKYVLTEEERTILRRNNLGSHAVAFQAQYEAKIGSEKSICFVGPGMETTREYYVGSRFPMRDREVFAKLVSGIAGFSLGKRDGTFDESLQESYWHNYDYEKAVNSGFPIGNLIFWELRSSRFQSEAISCQSTAFVPINPVAIRKIFELFQSPSFYRRKKGIYSVEFIRKSCPAIFGFDINGSSPVKSEENSVTSVELCDYTPSKGTHLLRQTLPDVIDLDSDTLVEGGEVFFRGNFESEVGSLRIGYVNEFSTGRPSSAVSHFVRVDGEEYFSGYIGRRGGHKTILVDGLKAGAVVEFGIRSNRDNGIAWKGASRTRLTEWAESKFGSGPEVVVSILG